MPSSSKPAPNVQPANLVERLFNRAFGWLIALGLAPANFYLLDVKGRKSGRTYSTPVDLLAYGGRDYLVAPRGRTQWVRNAEASATVTLRQKGSSRRYTVREIPPHERAPILKAYLDAYRAQVQRFFPVEAGSPVEAFEPLVERYPAFELRAQG